ncbi:hypothetical protein BW730_08325 [Tessaracoccus aquimaris]|uniref:Glycerate kinase n=1 Tax=Tessaracoccus aquimaris TaxID=1332264 RepID=A0A1Q2CN13_9ACTN|nr:glycerate kinase [Tessaracoccus aquimaris]AQP47497.1 hypothetical protein BW730_08325 [Tessaracoccus aquimaris]
MRVVIASDALAGLEPAASSEVIARAFAERGVSVAVVPLAATGRALREGIATSAPDHVVAAPSTSEDLGDLLRGDPARLVLDLTAIRVDDLGRGALVGADPAAELAEIARRWRARELVALVPDDQVGQEFTGLNGFASTQLRSEGADLTAVLAADAEAGRWAALLGIDPAPGAGAARGLGLLVQGAGGTVTDPLSFLVDRFGLAATIAQADLVVTGAESLDFHALGGPVVKRVAAMASEALRPVIAVVGRNFVSARELRLGGFETAYPLVPGGSEENPTPERLAEVAAHVARTWQW